MSDVRVVFSKWGARPHWEYDAVRLGADENGTWLGVPSGTRLSRPGADFCTEPAFVVLVPEAAPFTASFYADLPSGDVSSAPAWSVETYVDITTPPVWDGRTVRLVDLDLDVVKGRTGRVWVDDEDEFADHRTRFGYPDAVVRMALSSCESVRLAVESGHPPYDGRARAHWLGELEAAMMRS
ncbi:MAG TPA: DUF402 domain-containing protein [Nocardioidaceae bacterium]|nr:DUF402 domain-containing protein [Nocardioidaceae bacterium]